MDKKDKVLALYDKDDYLIATVVFNKIVKEGEFNILLDDNIIKIIIDDRNHQIVNSNGNTYKIISK